MADNLTPMMQQYRRIKGDLPAGVILLFRLGDFYEMFFEDAVQAAPILGIALTKRNEVPMCGVPFHALESYISKLVRAGKKAAICEQMEDPAMTKGIVRREVTSILTSGTATSDSTLEYNRNLFLACVYRSGKTYGLTMLDLSTGLFWGEESEDASVVRENITKFSPAECVVAETQAKDSDIRSILGSVSAMQVSPCADWTFDFGSAHEKMVRHFNVHSLDGFGCTGRNVIVCSAGAILHYVREDLHRETGHIRSFKVRDSAEFLVLDESTLSNLDIVGGRGRETGVSLLKVLDVTRTAMGARKLRDWVLRPLTDISKIKARQDCIEKMMKTRMLLKDLTESLGQVRDLERLIARIGTVGGNARDMNAIAQSLEAIPAVMKIIGGHGDPLLAELASDITPLPETVSSIRTSIIDEPPISIKEGGIIREGFHKELDEFRGSATAGRNWLAEYQVKEQARTGIKTLKVRHNSVFGYYIEISKGQADHAPADYTRKQTLVNAERFITPELKEYENKIVGAHDKAVALEYELFLEIRKQVVDRTDVIQKTADALACLDALAALADRSLALGYVRPVITDGDVMVIRDGRHPVVEQMPDAERFVPNDTTLNCTDSQIMIITGPNMAGKSTYIRQVALIVIMAQIGAFVPAKEANIGVVDRIFSRVGASDDLARGRSTFMVEMQETANILNNATSKSLIVLDEIGRGTSTFDGISIAWAVAEYLHDNAKVKAKTLFATHYHELTDLALTMNGVKNFNILVKESGGNVVFLRKIVPGGADKSYGIHVARLAGLPQDVIDRAHEILSNLEEGELGETGMPKIAKTKRTRILDNGMQMTLFG